MDQTVDLSEQALACLDALTKGDTDEVAARKLGLSRRTFRRRVKSALDVLGARSRFQAGYLYGVATVGRRGQETAHEDLSGSER